MTSSHGNSPIKGLTNGARSLAAVSLFSGCGGFCDGIELAGFSVNVSVELDKFAAETYRYNFPRVPLIHGDVSQFLTREAAAQIRAYRLTDIDLVFGGPPCQGYSQIGTRDLNDERNKLYLEFSRVVATLRPRIFLMENVPNVILMNKGHFRKAILREFARNGYSNTTFVKVTAADFGVPRLRQRVVFIGTRDEDGFPFDLRSSFEAALEGWRVLRHVSVDEALNDLPSRVVQSGETLPYPKASKPSAFQKAMRLDWSKGIYSRSAKRMRGIGSLPPMLFNHHTKDVRKKRAHLISLLKQGGNADTLPKNIWNGVRPGKWRRLHPEEPSYAILAQMHRDLSEWIHPHFDRWITVREAARLQSFHDGFVFQTSEWQQLKQIGNAVPPLLAHVLGRAARKLLEQNQQKRAKRRSNVMIQRVMSGLDANP